MTRELVKALAEFAELQKEHAALLRTNRLKTLPGWFNRREQVFNRLKQCFETFEQNSLSAGSSEAALIRKKMKALIAGEKELAEQVKCRQDNIGHKLQEMRKGKAILNKYSGSRAAVATPRYLSSRM